MFATKIKVALVGVLILGFVAAGGTVIASRMAARPDDEKAAAGRPMEPVAKKVHEKDKEAFTAWGKEGYDLHLQAGLGIRAGERQASHYGETVTLVVRVHNVGKEKVKFPYLKQFFIENPPLVTDAAGKSIPQARPAALVSHVPEEVSLPPGKEIELASVQYKLMPAREREKGHSGRPWPLYVVTGKVKLQYERLFGNTLAGRIKVGPDLLNLTTGRLELEIEPAPPAAGVVEKEAADDSPKASGRLEGQPVEFPKKAIADGLKATIGLLESCHSESRYQADELKKALRGDFIRLVFAKPITARVNNELIEVSELVFRLPMNTGVFWVRTGGKWRRYSKYEFQKEKPFVSWLRQARRKKAAGPPAGREQEEEPVRDFSSPGSGTILNLVLRDWFTNPSHRVEALSLLHDALSDPPGTPLPALRQVVIDVRSVPKGFRPAIPGVPTIVASRFDRTLERGELGIWVRRFEPRADGTIDIEFTEDNHGYTGNAAHYRARTNAGRCEIQFVRSHLGE